ncbi:hypothetical protein PAMP_017575 [Pampus punctatissimus]
MICGNVCITLLIGTLPFRSFVTGADRRIPSGCVWRGGRRERQADTNMTRNPLSNQTSPL